MKKRSYRTKTVKAASKHLAADVAGMSRIVVGLDVAKEGQFAAVMSEEKEVICTLRFTSPKENQAFVDLLTGCGPRVEVALESTGTYGDVLLHALRMAGVAVFQVGAKKVHDSKEIFDGVPSMHDAKAAMIIGRLHLEKVTRPWGELTSHQRTLKAAARTFARYDGSYQENIGRLEAHLARAWPELPAELKLTSATLLLVLAEYGTPQAVAADPEGAFALMRKVGGGFLDVEKIKRIIDAAGQSVGVPLVEAEREELQLLARDTNQLRLESKKSRRTIEELGQENESARNLKDLVGGLSIALVLMSVGDPRTYDSSQALMKAFGLNLKVHSSGKKKGQLSIAKRGPSMPRRYLYLAALRLIQKDPTTRAWYIRRLERNGVKKVKAVVAVMRKLVRAIWQIARTGEPFDATRLFDPANLQPLLGQPLVIPERIS